MESLDPIEIGYLRDLSIDLLTMVVVVRQRVIHFGGGELREFAQDLLDGQAAPVVLDDRADRETRAPDDRPPSLDAGSALHVRVHHIRRGRPGLSGIHGAGIALSGPEPLQGLAV